MPVNDGAGGSTTGAVTLRVGPAPRLNVAHETVLAYQSAASAVMGQTILRYVQAQDPEGQSVTFAWSTTLGSLGTPATTTTASEVVWKAGGCTVTATPSSKLLDRSRYPHTHSREAQEALSLATVSAGRAVSRSATSRARITGT
ncbi:MAG: hypothetical protein IT371_00425 [Deltaproteobacteria bacterium]|nr:hypothetical protein [Deltaproteobacteria bacterium]